MNDIAGVPVETKQPGDPGYVHPTYGRRDEHLQWCKERALEYVDAGDFQGAFASMTSDLGKHPETANHPGTELGFMLMMGGFNNTPQEMKDWINGYN